MKTCSYTISQYLRGKVRNINIPDETLSAIFVENGIYDDIDYVDVPQRNRDLALASLYVWVSTSPSSSQKITDKDADWEHSEGGETMPVSVLNRYLRMANEIYQRYGLPMVGGNRWGMVGRGFHDIRNCGGKWRNL